MGSGCTSCNNNQWQEPQIPDTRVQYTGDAIPELGICKGDKLNEVEEVVLNKILEFMNGEGITLSSLTIAQCDFLKQFVQVSNEDVSLVNVLDVLLKAVCQLSGDVITLTPATTVYNLKCLTVSNPTTEKVVQAIIDELCVHKTKIDELYAAIGGDSAIDNIKTIVVEQVVNMITACGGSGAITKSGSGIDTVLSFNAMVPPYTPIFSLAGLENFDSTGKGLAERGFCGWYICNGLNGTPDFRGLVPAGATNITGATSLPAAANPSNYPTLPSSTPYLTNMWDVRGEIAHKQTVDEMPSHTHIPDANIHSHTLTYYDVNVEPGSGAKVMAAAPVGGYSSTAKTLNTSGVPANTFAYVNITGGNKAAENRQPTIYGIYIMRKN